MTFQNVLGKLDGVHRNTLIDLNIIGELLPLRAAVLLGSDDDDVRVTCNFSRSCLFQYAPRKTGCSRQPPDRTPVPRPRRVALTLTSR